MQDMIEFERPILLLIVNGTTVRVFRMMDGERLGKTNEQKMSFQSTTHQFEPK
jgi:hypothetical protein